MYMLMSSGPLTDRKLRAHSVATALASSVLPVPAARQVYELMLYQDECYMKLFQQRTCMSPAA